MKKIIRNLIMIVALGFSPAIFPQIAAAQDNGSYQQQLADQSQYNNNDDVYNQGSNDIGGMSYQNYYNQLSPYGRWVYDPTYGYVWMPNAGPDFMPYSTGGHWAYTSYGWSWASDYAWGWAPFHYGRWDFTNSLGWYWIPGTVWGPAWVSWRCTEGYYGWAPLGPRYGYGYAYPFNRWTFCDNRYFGRYDAYRFYSPRAYNEGIFNRSSLVRNTYIDNGRHATYFSGPRRNEVERFNGTARDDNRTNFARNTNNYPRQANNNSARQNYNVPRQSYNAPRQNNLGAQRQSYNAQRQNNYRAPRQNNSSPRQSYSAPRQNYSRPTFASNHSNGNAGRNSGGHGGGGSRRSR